MIYFVIFYFIDIDVVTSNINYGNILWFWERCLHNSSKWGLYLLTAYTFGWLLYCSSCSNSVCERLGHCSGRIM